MGKWGVTVRPSVLRQSVEDEEVLLELDEESELDDEVDDESDDDEVDELDEDDEESDDEDESFGGRDVLPWSFL